MTPPPPGYHPFMARELHWTYLGRLPYREAQDLQESVREEVKRGDGPERLQLLEHPHVYTLGRNARAADVLGDAAARGVEVAECDRGGKVTYHGPGQLVGYPVIDLSPDRRDIRRYVVTVVTQVLVDERDPAFEDPSKPIGPFLALEEAERRRDELGWKIKEDAGRGWRRLVPSPRPVRVIQRQMIRDAARNGHIVVACGGGGIPISKNPHDQYVGIEAVIDKDLTSSVLAADVGAALLIILTAVPQVYVDFGKPSQRPLGAVTLEEIEAYFAEGHFEPGSMGPKIDAVIQFLRGGGRRALITNPESLPQAIEGRAGTHFVGKI